MRVVFSRPDDEEHAVVATVTWDGASAVVESEDAAIAAALGKAFRSTPVRTEDASYRSPGTHGEVQVGPGSLEWFRAVATERAPSETGLAARLIPGIVEGGFDPASGYRPFEEQLERMDAAARRLR